MDGLLREIRKWTNRLNYGKQLQRGHCDRNDDHRIGRQSVGREDGGAADAATKMKGADMENVDWITSRRPGRCRSGGRYDESARRSIGPRGPVASNHVFASLPAEVLTPPRLRQVFVLPPGRLPPSNKARIRRPAKDENPAKTFSRDFHRT